MALPIIAIVGRPNVGKSTLFNRLAGRRIAIVSDTPGTTRDRVSTDAEWFGVRFVLVDSAGIEGTPLAEQQLWNEVRQQSLVALQQADIAVVMVDIRAGDTPADREVLDMVRRAGIPYVVAANKADNEFTLSGLADWVPLTRSATVPISAYHNRGIDELMEATLALVPARDNLPDASHSIRVAIAGRPNVGKSALFNAITGEQRSIVSPVPGTTRDAIDATYEFGDQRLTFLDTAGLRRRGKTEQGIEKYSAIRSIAAIEGSHITLLLLDPTELVTAQDTHIAGFASQAHRAVIVVVNKWDLSEELEINKLEVIRQVRDRFKFIHDAPVLFSSAITGYGVKGIPSAITDVYRQFDKRADSSQLSQSLLMALGERPVPGTGRRRPRISSIIQDGVRPPTFVITCKHPENIHFSYKRYIENRIRGDHGFDAVPLRIFYRTN